MKYYLSTIADVNNPKEMLSASDGIYYAHHTAPVAAEYHMGLELAEFCISENLDEKQAEIMPFFDENARLAEEVIIHGPYNEMLPQAIDPRIVQVTRDRMDWIYDLCCRVGAKKLIVHANFVATLYYPQWFISRSVEFWKRFLEKKTGDVVICIENVTEQDPSLITEIVKQTEDPRVRMCLDVGHANLTAVPPEEWLYRSAPYISHYHIHNNDGPVSPNLPGLGDTHRGLGKGTVPMEKLLRQAEELTPSATASVESYEIEESCIWLKERGFL